MMHQENVIKMITECILVRRQNSPKYPFTALLSNIIIIPTLLMSRIYCSSAQCLWRTKYTGKINAAHVKTLRIEATIVRFHI